MLILPHVALGGGALILEPLAEHHRERLRAACAEDTQIWQIYPVSMIGAEFDPTFDAILASATRHAFAILDREEVIGTTSYFSQAPDGVVEIGGTYIVPRVRGSGLNTAVKRLTIDHAFAHGIRRIEFRVDTRNGRSMAAVAKLGATHEGVLRQNRVTWTGYIRDTAVFGLLRDEWPIR